MTSLATDFGQAARSLRRDPSAGLAAIGILALGIGANVAIFAVGYAVLLRPLPFEDQRALVIMWERDDRGNQPVTEVSYRDFLDWRSVSTSFAQMAAIGSVNWSAVLVRPDGPVTLPSAAVSGSFFDLLGTKPALGRGLDLSDDRLAGAPVAVLSHGTWLRFFDGNPAVVGTSVTLRVGTVSRAFTVVGVMPAAFDYPRGAALWLPVAPQLHDVSAQIGEDALEARWLGVLYVLGRLKPGVDLRQARTEMTALVGRLTRARAPEPRAAVVTPLVDHLFGQVRPALLALLAAAAVVLMLTCANVVGLLMARLLANRRQFAIRAALGAATTRLARQAAAEQLLLTVAGTAAGVVLAMWCVPLLMALAPPDVPRLDEVAIGAPVLGFALGVAGVTALACGLAPAMAILRSAPVDWLRAGGPGHAAPQRLPRSLVVVQIGLAVVLLVAAALTVRSYRAVRALDLGFTPAGVVTFDVEAPPGRYERPLVNRLFYRRALDRIRALPGVEAAGAVFLRPFEHGPIGSEGKVIVQGQSPDDPAAWADSPTMNHEAVTPDYFQVMGIPVLAGRPFAESDTHETAGAVIVSASAARRLWPAADPVGQRVLTTGYDRRDARGNPLWQTVVGVVADVRYRGLNDPRLDLYVPYGQSSDPVKHFVLRAATVPLSDLTVRVRDAIRSIDPDATVDSLRTMDAIVEREFAPWRFTSLLFFLLAALAVTLATFGIHALLSRLVADRTREIAIRIALGAETTQVVRFVAGRFAGLVALGVSAGLVTSLLGAEWMTRLVFGIRPIDWPAYAVACLVLIVGATAGATRPIIRAVSANPLVVLRHE